MSLGPRSPFDEGHDRQMDIVGRRKVALVHAQFVSAKADHHVAIPCQPASRNSLHSEHAQAAQEFIGVAWRRLQIERELRRIAAAPENGSQRAKHFTGPAMKSRFSFDQRSVDTSISLSVMRMLFTEDGRPPRDRLLIVPAVDTIVPRFVCSM